MAKNRKLKQFRPGRSAILDKGTAWEEPVVIASKPFTDRFGTFVIVYWESEVLAHTRDPIEYKKKIFKVKCPIERITLTG